MRETGGEGACRRATADIGQAPGTDRAPLGRRELIGRRLGQAPGRSPIASKTGVIWREVGNSATTTSSSSR